MRKVSIVLFLGFTFLLAASYSASAEMQCRSCHAEGIFVFARKPVGPARVLRGPGRGRRLFLKELGLSAQQKDAIRAIGFGVAKETIRKKAGIRVARIELRQLLQKDNVDMAAVKAKLKQLASLRTGLVLSHIKAMQEFKSTLTPGQRAKFREMSGGLGWMKKRRRACMCGGREKPVFAR